MFNVRPLLAQHRDKRGQQRHQQGRIQKVQGCDDLCGGPLHAGGVVEYSSGMMDRLRLRRIARRYASDRSLGSDWSFDWTSMTKAELTAENRPA